MKHHSTRGETKRSGRPKTKVVKKRTVIKCKDGCKEFYMSSHLEAGVCCTCKKCDYTFRVAPNGYSTEAKAPGIGNSHRDKEKASNYQKAYKERKLDVKIQRLVTDVFGGN